MKVNTLKALLLIAAKKDLRYYLNGIYVDHLKRLAIATDGCSMLVVKLEPDDLVSASVIISREAVENAVKIKNGQLVIEEDGRIKLGCMESKPVDGKYPNWARVVPTITTGEHSWIDAQRVNTMQEAASLITGEKYFKVKVRTSGDSAALVSLGPNALGVIHTLNESKAFSKDEPTWIAAMQTAIRTEVKPS
jgi:DNA polymerase-3 subunit beta